MVAAAVGARDGGILKFIGAAVNRTARLEQLTKRLDHRLLMSAYFAARVSGPVRSLGRHALPGVAEPQEVFTRAD